MKKYLQSTWMRVLSCIVCAISIISMMIGILGFVLVTSFGGYDEIYQTGYKMVAENYGLYALDMVEHGKVEKLQKEFAEKGIDCSIVLVTHKPDGNGNLIAVTEPIFTNAEIEDENKVEMDVVPGSGSRYRVNSLMAIMMGYTNYSDGDDWVDYSIEKAIFDTTTGLFYYQTAAGLYKVENIDVYTENVYFDYSLSEINGQEYYYNGYYQIKLDPTQYAAWTKVRINGHSMPLGTKGEWGDEIQVVSDGSLDLTYLRDCDYHAWGDYITSPYADYMDIYQVQVSWDAQTGGSLFQEWEDMYYTIQGFDSTAVPMIVLSFITFVIGFGLLIYSANSEKDKLGFMHRIPVFVYSGAIYGIEFLLLVIMVGGIDVLATNDLGKTKDIVTLAILIAFIMAWLAFIWLQNIVTRIKCRSFWRTSELYYVCKPIKWCWEKVASPFRKVYHLAKENTTLFTQGLIIFGGVTFIELWFFMEYKWYSELLFLGFIVVKLIEIPLLIYVLFQMQELQEGSKRIAAGDLSQPIDTKKLIWQFKKHGENINNVSKSIQLAVNEQMKSEHFKTELITNVSHDIKTPLTSIINYVDLIKKEEIADEKVQEYVDVLDRQSARLKKLIEDLMEASKASTGNLAVNLEECDVDVLLTQIIGEFEEKLLMNQLEIVVDKPEHPIKMMADGRHMWRVLDNLLNNVCKYSLPGTRVYLSLKQENSNVVIVFKNISKVALNIPSEELMERFVRGDSSRNTEGSGLGLSIAQSLTELMSGTMKLEIDGDLFKVTLRFPVIGAK